MPGEETQYQSVPYVYESRGLLCRDEIDAAPPHVYIDLLNCLERQENSMSSRYGSQIINRDPNGTPGGQNYLFTEPITSIARLNYQSFAQRYVGLQDGSLWTRQGNTQGIFTEIYTGLSGSPFGWLVSSTYASSQPWLYLYDASASIATALGAGLPRLTGIDPPPVTANTVPYSPLLTLIDSFASGNSYTTSDVSGWAYGAIVTYQANSSLPVTDFNEYLGIQQSGGTNYNPSSGLPASASVTQSTTGKSQATSGAVSGFSSVPISPSQTVSVTVTISGSITSTTGENGGGGVLWQYSVNGGASFSGSFYGIGGPGGESITGQKVTFSVTGLTNLNQLQFNVVATAGCGGPPLPIPSVTATGSITAAVATVATGAVFASLTNGMLAILGTTAASSVPIASIASSGFSGGLYRTLTITTSAAHGLTGTVPVGVYASTNDLCDGFYTATVTGTTTLTVPFVSAVAIGATGGTLWSNSAGTPPVCVLTNVYSTPYPFQFSAWGFYTQVPAATTAFPVSAWTGTVAASTTGSIGNTINLNLSQNNQVTDDDLIVLTLQVGDPNNIANIALQFDINGSGYTSSYYSKNISPAYYQGNLAGTISAYQATENQIIADTLDLIAGQPPDSTSAQLQPGNFSTGASAWATVYLRRGDFLPVGTAGQSGLDWSNVTGWQVVVTTNSGGSSTVALNGLYLQWGYGPTSFGGIGYDYRYTWWNNSTWTESSPSPEQQFSEQYGYLSSLAAPIFLSQAGQISGFYSADAQVTHVRIYRRGGDLASNWFLIDQIPNITTGGSFVYKDVISDAVLAQAQPLALDNDPPVTSTLPNPVATALAAATSGPSNTIYSTYTPQVVKVANAGTVFLTNQAVVVGTPANLEVVRVVAGGTGQFTAVLRLQHNAGEAVNIYAIPRQPVNLCATAYGRVWLAGDPNNPHYLYYSKTQLPENFGPQNYIPVSSPDDPIMAVINWRGTLFCGTLKTWYVIVGGATPRAQPTGAQHGIVASQGWTEVEGGIWFQAQDGQRLFTGADGAYMTLPVEWLYRDNPLAIPPLVDLAELSGVVCAYYNNWVLTSYVSLNAGNPRYRLVWDTVYKRWRYDDVAATAMLWEKDLNTLVVGKPLGSGYALVLDQVGDYDDGGWSGGSLVQTPINLAIQTPYRDLGKPHNPKQWNMLETDVNTQNQVLNTELLFEDGTETITLATANTGTARQKVELAVNAGAGQQAYRASIRHTMAVTVAPTLYQEAIHAQVLAGVDSTFDTYWLKPGGDFSVFIKEGYFDYTATAEIVVNLFADSSTVPYFTFTLPIQNSRYVQRVRFGNVNPAAPAFNCRLWRAIGTCTGTFQWWEKPRIQWKRVGQSSYQSLELPW